jgi:hypothetical protein
MKATKKPPYYSKVVRILNSAKQWERVRIIKALAIVYGIDLAALQGPKRQHHVP